MDRNTGMCGNVFVLYQPCRPGQTPIPHHHFDTWNPFLDVTSGMVKDPADVLDRQKCLDALAALRHAKWFQVRNIILLSSCSLMRCIILLYSFVCVFTHLVFLFYNQKANYLKQNIYIIYIQGCHLCQHESGQCVIHVMMINLSSSERHLKKNC